MSKVTYSLGSDDTPASPGTSILNIELKLINTFLFEETPIVGEDQNYICTHFRIGVNCIFNPATTSARRTVASTSLALGFPASRTEEALRFFLMQPRGVLKYEHEDGFIQLQSPRDNTGFVGGPILPNDARNGPIPLKCAVQYVSETRSFLVTWVVDTWVQETWKYTGPLTPVLLSHAWQQVETLDDQYFATRLTSGRATFAADRLFQAQTVPDDYRNFITPPINGAFKRVQSNVVATADGTTVTYECIDREMRCSLKKNGIAEVDVINEAGTFAPEIAPTLTQAGLSTTRLAASIADARMAHASASAAAAAAGHAVPAPPGGGFATGVAAAGIAFQFVASNLGRSIYSCTVRVYGTRAARVPFMVEQGLKIIAWHLSTNDGSTRPGRGGTGFPFIGLNIAGYNTSLKISHDVKAGVVEITKTHSSCTSGLMLQHVQDWISGGSDDIEPTIGSYAATPNMAVSAVAGASAPPEGRSRGYWIGNVISQQLSGLYEKPAKPRLRQRRADTTDPQR